MNRDLRGQANGVPGNGMGEPGPTGHLLPVRISSLILVFAAALIAIFTASMLYVGWLSSQEADQQAYGSETRLFRNVLDSRFTMLARDQFQEGVWDEAVKHISLKFDRDWVESEMVGGFWYNYGLDRTLLVAPGYKVLAYAREGEVDFSANALTLDADLKALIDRATAQYMQNRITIQGGFSARAATIGDRAVMLSEIGNIFEGAYQNIEGKPALVSAMAIVPDQNEVALPDGPPIVLINAKFIDADELAYLRHQLGFPSLDFIAGSGQAAKAPIAGAHEDITTLSGTVIGTFTWQNALPGQHIWSIILPIVSAIGVLVAIAAMLVARRLASMSTLLENSERRTRHMSRHDALTGLANRIRFGEALSEAVAGLPQTSFAVIACDLDRFKVVNDTYGHAAGDTVICEIADRLVREVGDAGVVSRTGGDEFILLITGYADKRRLNLLCAGIIEHVLQPIRLDRTQQADVGVSLGVAQAPLCGTTDSAIMRAADEALYAAKELGRGRAVFAEDAGASEPDAETPTLRVAAER